MSSSDAGASPSASDAASVSTGVRAAAKAWSVFDASNSTAQVTAMLRCVHPDWRTPGATIQGPKGEKFGFDPIAPHFLTPEQRALSTRPEFAEKARQYVGKEYPGLGPWLWQRTRVIDSELFRALASEAPPQQLLVLGAGYDTRSYRFRQALDAHKVRRFESDLPTLQTEKRAAMEKVAAAEGDIGLDQVTFVPLDLTKPKEELLAALRATGYSTEQRTFFVLEGVTTYLTSEANASALQFMSAASAPGSILVVTFISQNVATHEGGGERMVRQLAEKNEPHKCYPSVDEMTAWVRAADWEPVRLLTPEILDAEFSTPDEGVHWPGAHIYIARRK